MSERAAAPGARTGVTAHRVLGWRLPGFALMALAGLVALAVGWTTTADGWYLAGILLSALGGAGVGWVLLWRRPVAAVTAVAAVGVLVLGLGLGAPWWQVASAYSHEGVALQPTRQDSSGDADQGFLLVQDSELLMVDDSGRMRPWWSGTLREATQVSQHGGAGALIYHALRAEGIVYLLDGEGEEQARWRFDLPAERDDGWRDGGVVALTAQTVVWQWCQSHQDCQWTGFDADSGEQQWQVDGAPVPNAALARPGLSGAGGTATVGGFWVGTRTDDGAVQLRDPDTGSVQHTVAADEPVVLAGDRAVVGGIEEDGCLLQVLDAGGQQSQDDDGEQEPPAAEVACAVVQALAHAPTGADYLDGDLLWLRGAGRSHVIELDTARTRTVAQRVAGGRNSTADYGGRSSWTAGAGVLLNHDSHQVQALDPLTGAELWTAGLAGSAPDVPLPASPVVIAAEGVVSVQVPDQALLLEDAVQESERTTMVLHAFDARTGQALMAPLRHREDPAGVQVRAGRILLPTTEDGEPAGTVMFSP